MSKTCKWACWEINCTVEYTHTTQYTLCMDTGRSWSEHTCKKCNLSNPEIDGVLELVPVTQTLIHGNVIVALFVKPRMSILSMVGIVYSSYVFLECRKARYGFLEIRRRYFDRSGACIVNVFLKLCPYMRVLHLAYKDLSKKYITISVSSLCYTRWFLCRVCQSTTLLLYSI